MKKLVLIAVFMVLFSFSAFATAGGSNAKNDTASTSSDDITKVYGDQYEASGANELENKLPVETQTILKELHIDPANPASMASINTKNIFEKAFEMVKDRAKAPIRACAAVIGVLLLCALINALKSPAGGKVLSGVYSYCAALAIGIIILTPAMQSVLTAIESIKSCGIFMLAFVPVFAAIVISSGKVATAAGFQALVFSAAQIVVQLASLVLAPAVGMYLAVGAAGSLSQDIKLDGIAEGMKKISTWVITLTMTIFLGILSVQTVIGSATDSVGAKAAKFFVGSFVPVVGSLLGEALTTVQSCLTLLKSSLGIYAAITIVLILLPSILEILLWKAVIMLSAAASDVFTLEKTSASLRAINGALSMLLGIQICCAVLFVISTAVVVMVGGGQ